MTPSDKIHDTAAGRALFASLTAEQQAVYRPSVADERLNKRRDEPERAPRLTYPEAQHLKGALGVALIDGTAETARMVTAEEYGLLQAAIDRATLQPSECSHDDFEFPMHACPRCGHNF